MKRSILYGAAAVMSLFAAPVSAQGDGTFQTLTKPASPQFFNRTGQWTADFAGLPNLTQAPGLNTPFYVFCVDYDGNMAVPSSYNAWSTEIFGGNAELATQTEQGLIGGTAYAFERYWKAAFLVDHFFNTAGQTYTSDASAWQNAIWTITEGVPMGSPGQAAQIAGLVALANASFIARTDDFLFAGWSVITAVNKDNNTQELIYRVAGPPQEIVPEPATMSLLALGLAGMAGANAKRRKKNQA